MSDHDGLVLVYDAGLVAFENNLATVVGENSNGEESVVAELGEDVSFLGGGGQHVKAWDCTGVGGLDFAAVREGNADAEVGRYRDWIGARRGREEEMAGGAGVEDGGRVGRRGVYEGGR
jgi:hypothetical protein